MNDSVLFVLEVSLGLSILLVISPSTAIAFSIFILALLFLQNHRDTDRQVAVIFTTAMLLAFNAVIPLLLQTLF